MDLMKETVLNQILSYIKNVIIWALGALATFEIIYLVKFAWHIPVRNFTMNQNTFAAKFEILNKNKKPKGQHLVYNTQDEE